MTQIARLRRHYCQYGPGNQWTRPGIINGMAWKQMTRRLVQLYVGLWLYGTSSALQVQASLGLDPWDVLHQGIAAHTGLAIGTVSIIVGAVVLLGWIPLRQWPGLGTVSNVVLVGVSLNMTLMWLPHPHLLVERIGMLAAGIVLCGVATGMYIGAHFGPGPRDGLMTGIARRTGRSIRLVRGCIEVTVLIVGWILGGTVGVGTVAFALAIGPLAQIFMPIFDVEAAIVTQPRVALVVLVVSPSQPRSEPLDRDLELRARVDERLQPVAEPFDADLLLTPSGDELLDATIGEVHPGRPRRTRTRRPRAAELRARRANRPPATPTHDEWPGAAADRPGARAG